MCSYLDHECAAQKCVHTLILNVFVPWPWVCSLDYDHKCIHTLILAVFITWRWVCSYLEMKAAQCIHTLMLAVFITWWWVCSYLEMKAGYKRQFLHSELFCWLLVVVAVTTFDLCWATEVLRSCEPSSTNISSTSDFEHIYYHHHHHHHQHQWCFCVPLTQSRTSKALQSLNKVK